MKRFVDLEVWIEDGWETRRFEIIDGFWDRHGKRWSICKDAEGRIRGVKLPAKGARNG